MLSRPLLASLNQRLFCVYVLFMLLRVAIATRALFEGARPLIFTKHTRSSKNLIVDTHLIASPSVLITIIVVLKSALIDAEKTSGLRM